MRRLLCLLPVLLVWTGCSTSEDFTPSGPSGPSIPTIGGTYSSSTMWRFELASAAEQNTFTCAGGVTIATQVGNDFSGTFFIRDANCGDLGGNVTGGTLQSNGTVAFFLTVPQTDPNFITWAFGCTYVSGDRGVAGTLVGTQLDVQSRTVMDCGPDGQVTLVMRLSGTR
jgi:hypothetical protein